MLLGYEDGFKFNSIIKQSGLFMPKWSSIKCGGWGIKGNILGFQGKEWCLKQKKIMM